MMRVIVTPAVLPPSALAELKQWLGITTTLDDAPLSALLAMALDVCADFIGFLPLVCDVEETIGLRALPHPVDWQVRRCSHEWLTAGTLGGWHGLGLTRLRPVAGGGL